VPKFIDKLNTIGYESIEIVFTVLKEVVNMVREKIQRRVKEELKAFARIAMEQLFGIYRVAPAVKPKQQRVLLTVLHSGVDLEQCTYCLQWFPYEELTLDKDEQPVCKRCSSLVGQW